MTKPKVRWLGNSHKREFHRVVEGTKQPRGCNLERMNPNNVLAWIKNRVPYKLWPTAKELRLQGYDACAYCTRKFVSKENT